MLPIIFEPIYKERIWGGRALERDLERDLPNPNIRYGESWELCDREDDQTFVMGGVYDGLSLQELWRDHREEVFGNGLRVSERFPLLIKILDCREDLSVQVHPPAVVAESLGGEPKTEMWYVASVDSGAELYVGLKPGVDELQFRDSIDSDSVAQCIQVIKVKPRDSVFLESGVIHAIGGGHLIYEIQQNSDTTYRVYDWGRLGLDGKPRDLHVEESMKSIVWDAKTEVISGVGVRAENELFSSTELEFSQGEVLTVADRGRFAVINVVKGCLQDKQGVSYQAGTSLLLPANASEVLAVADVLLLVTQM